MSVGGRNLDDRRGGYFERLRGYRRIIYAAGRKLDENRWFEHLNVRLTINAIAKTYDLAPSYAVHSDLVGEEVNVLNAVMKSPESLVKRYNYQRELSLRLATCNYRCTGCDAINSLYPITKLVDESRGTDYHD
ncbi:MAG: hypothetical protein HA491_05115, partial [Candidatus Verstraetearchaeota archaeon]|nr:hypothetical protein [Candidatus Verstraetearchaeota archaeon]